MNQGRVVFDGAPAELTAARVHEVYGVTEEELAEQAEAAVRARSRPTLARAAA